MYKIYGKNDMDNAPPESMEQTSFFNQLSKAHPIVASVAVHIPNEGLRTMPQISAMKSRGGYIKGASDIFIPGNPSLLIELKSRSKKSKISKDQDSYLNNAKLLGSMVCVCYGWQAAMEAVEEWMSTLHGGV